MAGLKTGTRSASASSKNDVKKGTMTTMTPIMTNHTDSALSRGGNQEESELILMN
jgi:hypothetical protein